MCTPSLIIFQEHYTNEALEMKVTVTILKMVIEVQSNPKQIKHAPYIKYACVNQVLTFGFFKYTKVCNIT